MMLEAKIAGIKLCESYRRQYGRDYRCVMPTNLYGPYDTFDPQNGHVIPALIYKFSQAIRCQASHVDIWGSGQVRREFMHVDELAEASLYLMGLSEKCFWDSIDEQCSHINIGTGKDCSIRYLAEMIHRISQYSGDLHFDTSKPEGTPVKLLEVSKLNNMGWQSSVSLEEGLQQVWDWYSENY